MTIPFHRYYLADAASRAGYVHVARRLYYGFRCPAHTQRRSLAVSYLWLEGHHRFVENLGTFNPADRPSTASESGTKTWERDKEALSPAEESLFEDLKYDGR